MESMDKLKHILEAVLLAASDPLPIERLLDIFAGDLVDEQGERPDRATLKTVLEALQGDYAGRGVQLVEVASGYRFQTRADLSIWVNKLWEERPQKYSRALLETLAIIAYRQPITRGEIEDIRGVAVSANIMKLLTEREWVRIVGHRDVPGRPAVYATTKQFLDYFNLRSLSELPSLAELRDIDDVNLDLFGNPMSVPAGGETMAEADGDDGDDDGEIVSDAGNAAGDGDAANDSVDATASPADHIDDDAVADADADSDDMASIDHIDDGAAAIGEPDEATRSLESDGEADATPRAAAE
jgi:segregation and condensation protein B